MATTAVLGYATVQPTTSAAAHKDDDDDDADDDQIGARSHY